MTVGYRELHNRVACGLVTKFKRSGLIPNGHAYKIWKIVDENKMVREDGVELPLNDYFTDSCHPYMRDLTFIILEE